MNDYTLDADKLAELRAAHRATRDKREADRIKAVVLLATGWSAKAVTEYLQTSRIKLVFLPAYAPNLNLIERLWKFFKKSILYNRYFETFAEFKAACEELFANPGKYRRELGSLLTENFEIVG